MSRQDYVDYAAQAAQDAGISPEIFVRQIQQESGFQPYRPDGSPLVSPAGAIGIAQFMPGTAAGRGVDPADPYASLDAAAKLMRSYLDKYGSWELALAAYNAGGGAVDKYGGVPPYQETHNYVAAILGGESIPVDAPAAGGGLPVIPVAVGVLLILALLEG